jgi:prolyl-tRNA editing enzyme YbaK/EbsC (Cys-tRNA(Pro) deacylase)
MSEPNEDRAITRVREAAARKGVTLEIVLMDASTHTAADASTAVGAELGQIVKSLVFVTPDGAGGLVPLICLVSGTNRVDVARLARETGEPEVRRATAREAHDLTGYSIGGIPPFGYSMPVRVVMDPDLEQFPVIWAAAGTGTAVFPIEPARLRMLADATVARIAEGVPA